LIIRLWLTFLGHPVVDITPCFVPHTYRIRTKKKNGSYALSLSYRHETKHYRIDQKKTRDGIQFAIERGPQFSNLMDVRCSLLSSFSRLWMTSQKD